MCTGVCLSGWVGAVFSCYPEEGMRTASFCWICYWPADGLESDRKLGETLDREPSSQNPTQRDSVVSDGTLALESHQQSPPVSPLHVSPNNRGGKERVLWYQCFFNLWRGKSKGKTTHRTSGKDSGNSRNHTDRKQAQQPALPLLMLIRPTEDRKCLRGKINNSERETANNKISALNQWAN